LAKVKLLFLLVLSVFAALFMTQWLLRETAEEMLRITQTPAAAASLPAEPRVAGEVSTGLDGAPDATQDGAGRSGTGDWSDVLERGVLRVAVPGSRAGDLPLPRLGTPVHDERELAEAFARAHRLQVEWVPVFQLGEMMELLAQGKVDLVAANLTITEARRQSMAFSLPIDQVQEVVLVDVREEGIQGPADLVGRTVMVDSASTFWDSLQTLREQYPDIQVVPTRAHFDDERVLDFIVAGHMDATVRDSNIAAMYLAYRQDLRVAFPLGERRPIAWAVRPDAPELLAAVNRFLTQEQLTRAAEPFLGDLPEIKERRRLRVLLPNTAASYFLWRGDLVGFEYEWVKAFAEEHKLRLEVIVPPHPAMAYDWLARGLADIGGGFLERTTLPEDSAIVFTDSWHAAQTYLLGRSTDAYQPDSWEGLRGRQVGTVARGALWQDLLGLAAQHGFSLVPLPDTGADAEEMMQALLDGRVDFLVLEEHVLAIELAQRPEIQRLFPVGAAVAHAWLVRAGNPQLQEALDAFIQRQVRKEMYNVLYRRYFVDERQILRRQTERVRLAGQLSEWDELIRAQAEALNFDWRLIAAIIYEESRFDPDAVSRMGATGLMQIMPRAAAQVGMQEYQSPADNVRAGVLYLDWVRSRFSEDLTPAERIWFALAAYNAGIGHVMDARRLAEQKGWDRDRWFDHVEQAMLLLSRRQYHSQSRHGYVRGSETVAYLRNIRDRYRAYVRLLEAPVAQVESGLPEHWVAASP
jgi:membrane-bound lytic murein transglycosylase F